MLTETTTNLAQQRDQLAAIYRALPPLKQELVQLFSVVYEPVSRTTFMSCCSVAGIRDPDGKSFVNKTLKPHLDKLLAEELLVQESGRGLQCHRLLTEIATREAVRSGRFPAMVKAVETKIPIYRPSWKHAPRHFQNREQFLREVRIGIYNQDLDFINQQFADYQRYAYRLEAITLEDVAHQVFNNPFDKEWFRTVPTALYESVLTTLLIHSLWHLEPAEESFSLLEEDCLAAEPCPGPLSLVMTEQLIFRGRVQEAEHSLQRIPDEYRIGIASFNGWLALLHGDHKKAIEHYSSALMALTKASRKRKNYFNGNAGLFFILALLKAGSPEHLREAEDHAGFMARQSKHPLATVYSMLQKVLQVQQGNLAKKKELLADSSALNDADGLRTLVGALCLYWTDPKQAKRRLPPMVKAFYEKAVNARYQWLAMEAAELLARLEPSSHYGERAATLRAESSVQSIVDVIRPRPPWELSLNALANLNQEANEPSKSPARQRLAWFISVHGSSGSLQPREQKIDAKGRWTKGRNVALARLSKRPQEFSYLTAQDLRACAHIRAHPYGYYGQTEYQFTDKAVTALIGHPLVFREDAPATRVDVVKGEPELLVTKQRNDHLCLQFQPELQEDQDVLVVQESPARVRVIEITPQQRRVAEIIGKRNRLEVPGRAKERVLAAINAVSGIVTVHSHIGAEVQNAEEVAAQARPHVQLLPAGAGLRVAMLIRPFPQGGPYYRPATGGTTVIAEINGKRLQTTRDFREERRQTQAAVSACPTLLRAEETDGEWLVEDPQDCLQLLLELQALGEAVVLEWPEGEKLRISHHASFEQLKLNIAHERDWFAASGQLKLDDNLVLDMQKLLELLQQSPGRFVRLDNGQFLALTDEFRRRLDELQTFSERHGKGVRIHPLAALALEDLVDAAGDLHTDTHWQKHITRLHEMQRLQPALPSTLQAELRDYQIDGFNWLSRLAHWGVGACLADDMGLGKTLQALAVILTRAPAGPTLIVAPTSVCMNWESEAHRFAPTLNTIQFGPGDRRSVLDNLQPFDMVICSYGMLQQEEVATMLAQVTWQTIVLDEAHAIKNIATKRSQAAMRLQGQFKLLTTGTPIENHLGELWNLFRFINPGLLGSLERFNERYAVPIERYQDAQARNKLKKLIRPFLLRRTKNQVLEQLPSRTEIMLHVDLSQAEMAFYEALRQQAVTKLAESDAPDGQKHLQILAEIMRLRRACCNTRLVMPDSELSSAKLQVFGEVLDELLDNKHKALVFSQFVDHLHILRDYLNTRDIPYQYLDGSTPAVERGKRVTAFQSGTGDVFLISLKAGGTGLNLTAADYVIHMDPWWNPAVEDQASDRAHRIGQQRPVTIYRLVAKDTIEEKIIDLHQHKRDLADSLLEGADLTGRMSTEELMRLISEG
jgi:superfamily II DNA or RNA helicase